MEISVREEEKKNISKNVSRHTSFCSSFSGSCCLGRERESSSTVSTRGKQRGHTPDLSRGSRIEKSRSEPSSSVYRYPGKLRFAEPVSPEELKFRSRRLGFSSESTLSRFYDPPAPLSERQLSMHPSSNWRAARQIWIRNFHPLTTRMNGLLSLLPLSFSLPSF